MIAAYDWLAEVSAWWWPRFADHLWQSTLFALVILAAAFVLRRGPARWRHTFCLIAAGKFLVPATLFVLLAQQTGLHSLSFLRSTQQTAPHTVLLQGITEPAAAFAGTYEVTVVATNPDRHEQRYLALTAIWLTGSLTILLLHGIRRRRFLRSLRLGLSVRSGREWQALERARESLRWRGRGEVGLVISPLQIEPAVWRVWRPTVVLPDSIAGHLDDAELEAILLHELVHIQRRDNLIGNLQLALCALLWFHPLVWFISRRLFDEREQACDEKVLEVCLAPEAYASSILKVVRFCFGWRVAGVTGAAGGSNLRRRIENIMSTGNTKRRAGGASRLLATALAGLALLILVAAGIYTHPLTANAAANDTAVSAGVNNEVLAQTAEAAADKRSSQKTRTMPPPPPAPAEPDESPGVTQPPQPPQPPKPAQSESPAQPAQPAQPPHPAQQAQPAQPPTPPTPPAPETPVAEKSDKNKPVKEKEKSKQKIKKGALIEAPRPAYPDEIKAQKIEGTVAVVFTIGDDGNVIQAKADSGPRALHAVSEAAALKARFEPTLVDGKPAKVTGVVTYNFKLAE